MSYQVIKMIVYVVSVMLSMWSLSCFNFDNISSFCTLLDRHVL